MLNARATHLSSIDSLLLALGPALDTPADSMHPSTVVPRLLLTASAVCIGVLMLAASAAAFANAGGPPDVAGTYAFVDNGDPFAGLANDKGFSFVSFVNGSYQVQFGELQAASRQVACCSALQPPPSPH